MYYSFKIHTFQSVLQDRLVPILALPAQVSKILPQSRLPPPSVQYLQQNLNIPILNLTHGFI